jgi:hypothetical protein
MMVSSARNQGNHDGKHCFYHTNPYKYPKGEEQSYQKIDTNFVSKSEKETCKLLKHI